MPRDKERALARNWFYYHKDLAESRRLNREKRKRLVDRWKAELSLVFGNKCILCGSLQHIVNHEIHGNPHYSHTLTRKDIEYRIKHKEDFVSICQRHHNLLHEFIRLFKDANKEELLKLLRNLLEGRE